MHTIFRVRLLAISCAITASLCAQDDIRDVRERKKAAQLALRKKMGPLRNEEAMNAMTQQFQNISVKPTPMLPQDTWRQYAEEIAIGNIISDMETDDE